MADRIRSHSWEKTAFGPISEWPLELLSLVNLMLASREIMTIFWGPGRLMIYNDAYTLQLGSRHPVLAKSFHEVWPDAFDQVNPFVLTAFDEGKSSYLDDAPVMIMEDGQPIQRYYSASFDPVWVRQASGSAVQGVFQTAINITAKVESTLR